jgi:hypothetical protein
MVGRISHPAVLLQAILQQALVVAAVVQRMVLAKPVRLAVLAPPAMLKSPSSATSDDFTVTLARSGD